MKYGIFYGSTTGATKAVARSLARLLNVADADVYDVATTAPSAVAPYDVIILGASTWSGDMQADMADFLDGLAATTLKGKKVAFFGTGDETMADSFCDAVGEMYKRMRPTGATVIGLESDSAFSFHHSDAELPDGKLAGLLLDTVNHPDLTDTRLAAWVADLEREA